MKKVNNKMNLQDHTGADTVDGREGKEIFTYFLSFEFEFICLFA